MTHTDGFTNVEMLINRFGGMRPMSRKIDVPVSTIQGWKKRDFIPAEHVDKISAAARKHHVSLDGFGISKSVEAHEPINKPTSAQPDLPPENSGKNNDVPPVLNDSPLRPRGNTATFQNNPGIVQGLNAEQLRRDTMRRSALTSFVVVGLVAGAAALLFWHDFREL